MEDTAIRKGFEELKDGSDYENLCQAAISRAQADWLIGMNATRAFTTTYGKTFKVGRVQTPTLAMLVERQERMEGFQKRRITRLRLPIRAWCSFLKIWKIKLRRMLWRQSAIKNRR
ncbi:MAG: DNA topoisomerase [Ruminococcus sp.]